MKTNVIWLSFKKDVPARGYWDHGMVEDLLSNRLWNPVGGLDFNHHDTIDSFHKGRGAFRPGAIVVFPARSQTDYVEELNSVLKDMPWVVLMLTGDEEASFPVEKVKHDNIQIYVMSPRPDKHDNIKYRFLGTGYPPQIHDHISTDPPEKTLNWFFAGQVTHDRRYECVEKLRDMKYGKLVETEGFTQGISPAQYYDSMSKARVTPCPSGPETPDTFRIFESLELACIPIADTKVPKDNFPQDYWTYFFGEEPPFPTISNYEQLPGYVSDQARRFPKNLNFVFSWWIKKKREFAYQLINDVRILSGETEFKPDNIRDGITVIIPCSPIKSHPKIDILDETIKSIRHHLPDSEIILTFDGVRPEQKSRADDYEEFKRRILWKCNTEYHGVVPLAFDEHRHQTGLARAALQWVKTPLILYVEQDTPLVVESEIPFKELMDPILTGKSNMIRLHHEGVIPPDHQHMIHGMESGLDVPLMRTSQWSQRPHLASVAFYNRILSENFSEDAKSFIEDLMHGIASQAYVIDGTLGWHQYKIHIYSPAGNIRRSSHTDGRAGEPKYDGTQVF